MARVVVLASNRTLFSLPVCVLEGGEGAEGGGGG